MIWHRLWRSSIKNRLTFLFFVITAGAILVIYFYVVPQLETSLISQKVDALERESAVYSRSLQRYATGSPEVTAGKLDALTSAISEKTGARVALWDIPVDELDPHNVLPPYAVSDSQESDTPLDPSTDLIIDTARRGRTLTSTRAEGGGELVQVARAVRDRDGIRWVAIFSEPLRDVQDNVDLIRRQILIAGLLALIVAVASGYYAASVIARRVKRLERAAGDVAAGDFSKPIPVDSDDELGQLAQAFDEMQRKLARLDTARREFIANASHELRTPIFSLGGFVELLQSEDIDEETRAEFLETMREQVDRLQKLTTDLLDLSRLDAGSLDLELEPVPLRSLARQVAGEFAAAAARTGSDIELVDTDAPNDVEAACDPQRTAQIVRILVDNAITHTPPGTHVSIEARSARGVAQLEVTDDGAGIEPRDLAHVFDRFHAGSSGRGSGLGLAIARELALHMQGTLVVSSMPGRTSFVLTLPLARERQALPEMDNTVGAAGPVHSRTGA